MKNHYYYQPVFFNQVGRSFIRDFLHSPAQMTGADLQLPGQLYCKNSGEVTLSPITFIIFCN
jgi:hypothetical protein